MDLDTVKKKQYPYVTIGLIVINVIVFLVSDAEDDWFMYDHGASDWEAVFFNHEYYRLFTSTFLHSGMEHLANNMLMLAVLGSYVEPATGSIRFLLIYIGSGICASFGSCLWYRHLGVYTVSVGASGAIFGIVGTLVVLTILNQERIGTEFKNRLLIIVVLMVIDGYTTEYVDYAAHLAGLIAGSILAFVLLMRTYMLKKQK
jgi:rhomboid protease GluP